MNRVKHNAQTISFFWAPFGYKARWADAPEEVPIWDLSRGFPLSVGMDSAPSAAVKASNQLELLRALLRHGHVDYKDSAATWEPLPPPAEGYPRLVRDTDKMVLGYFRTTEDVIGDIGTLAKDIPAWRAGDPVKVLKRKVLELNEKYGAPYGVDENGRIHNTLEAWLRLVVMVSVHTQAMHEFKVLGYELMLNGLESKRASLESQRVFDEEAYRRANEAIEYTTPGKPFSVWSPEAFMLRNLDEVERIELLSTENLLRAAQDAQEDAEAFRKRVADELYKTFNVNVTLDPEGVIIRESLHFWACHKLSQMWLHGAEVRACAACGQLFVPKRGNTIYCKPSCADGRYRETDKGREAQARRQAKRKQKAHDAQP